MDELGKYRERCANHAMCADSAAKWAGCVSNRELFDLAGESQVAHFLLQSVSEGWGLPPAYIAERFSHFINGRYVSSHACQNGTAYTTAIYCRHDGTVDAVETLYVLIDCNIRLVAPERSVIRVFADAGTRLAVDAGEDSLVTVTKWGADADNPVSSEGKGTVRVRYERIRDSF